MIFFRKLMFIICVLFASSIAHADNHDTEKNIIEKAKEINKKVKKKTSITRLKYKLRNWQGRTFAIE